MSTLAELVTSVTRRTGNDDSTGITEYINEAYDDVLVRTKCKVTAGTFALSAGYGDYAWDDDILEIVEVSTITSGGVNYVPSRVTAQEILRLRANSSASSPALSYAVEGGNLLMVYPTPAADDTVMIYYVPRPTALTGSDTPSYIPAQWHKALFYYAAAEASDDRDDASSGQGELYRAKYEAMLKEIRKNTWRMGGRRLPRATVGSSRFASHDNSADWR